MTCFFIFDYLVVNEQYKKKMRIKLFIDLNKLSN